jgi:hypothetical protein
MSVSAYRDGVRTHARQKSRIMTALQALEVTWTRRLSRVKLSSFRSICDRGVATGGLIQQRNI